MIEDQDFYDDYYTWSNDHENTLLAVNMKSQESDTHWIWWFKKVLRRWTSIRSS